MKANVASPKRVRYGQSVPPSHIAPLTGSPGSSLGRARRTWVYSASDSGWNSYVRAADSNLSEGAGAGT